MREQAQLVVVDESEMERQIADEQDAAAVAASAAAAEEKQEKEARRQQELADRAKAERLSRIDYGCVYN